MDIDMGRLISVLVGAVLAAIVLSVATPSHAQIYKYKRKDGSVVYTDKLVDLPPKVRAKYAEREAKKARERARLEASIGKREVERREAEEKRRAELERQIKVADQRRRRQELRALLKRLNEQEAEEEKKKALWKKRVKDARTAVKELFEKFTKTQQAYDNLAVRADYALFPGQAQEKDKLRKELAKLEKELDAALEELNVKIPTEARKQGIPPGWIR